LMSWEKKPPQTKEKGCHSNSKTGRIVNGRLVVTQSRCGFGRKARNKAIHLPRHGACGRSLHVKEQLIVVRFKKRSNVLRRAWRISGRRAHQCSCPNQNKTCLDSRLKGLQTPPKQGKRMREFAQIRTGGMPEC